MKHNIGNGDERCCVAHADGEDSCYRCLACGRWIRPSKVKEECEGRFDWKTVPASITIVRTGEGKAHAELGSYCCGSMLIALEKEVVKRHSYGESHYQHKCLSCGNPCWTIHLRRFDTDGKEILPTDIVECIDEPVDSALRWQAAYKKGLELVIRDLGNNNVGCCDGRHYTRGPYWKHLDKLTDEDLAYYWRTTRDLAREVLRNSK